MLVKMESENPDLKSITIDDDGVYKYHFNMPEEIEVIEQVHAPDYTIDADCQLYVISRSGDILLDVLIEGSFTSCEMYQYDSMGYHKEVYATLKSSGVMNPFPQSGIPLIQCGKCIYIQVHEPRSEIQVHAKYAFLNTTCRRKLAQYTHPDDEPIYNHNNKLIYTHGVKIKHANNDIYQVYNVGDSGFSPNYLGKEYTIRNA